MRAIVRALTTALGAVALVLAAGSVVASWPTLRVAGALLSVMLVGLALGAHLDRRLRGDRRG